MDKQTILQLSLALNKSFQQPEDSKESPPTQPKEEKQLDQAEEFYCSIKPKSKKLTAPQRI
jgi:hypothetical protein